MAGTVLLDDGAHLHPSERPGAEVEIQRIERQPLRRSHRGGEGVLQRPLKER